MLLMLEVLVRTKEEITIKLSKTIILPLTKTKKDLLLQWENSLLLWGTKRISYLKFRIWFNKLKICIKKGIAQERRESIRQLFSSIQIRLKSNLIILKHFLIEDLLTTRLENMIMLLKITVRQFWLTLKMLLHITIKEFL